jgi:hypothetical protein
VVSAARWYANFVLQVSGHSREGGPGETVIVLGTGGFASEGSLFLAVRGAPCPWSVGGILARPAPEEACHAAARAWGLPRHAPDVVKFSVELYVGVVFVCAGYGADRRSGRVLDAASGGCRSCGDSSCRQSRGR